jgi:hypothetical protein
MFAPPSFLLCGFHSLEGQEQMRSSSRFFLRHCAFSFCDVPISQRRVVACALLDIGESQW